MIAKVTGKKVRLGWWDKAESKGFECPVCGNRVEVIGYKRKGGWGRTIWRCDCGFYEERAIRPSKARKYRLNKQGS